MAESVPRKGYSGALIFEQRRTLWACRFTGWICNF